MTRLRNRREIDRSLRRLITSLGGAEFSVCVRSALSALAALAGRPEFADCIDEGRAAASGAGDVELATRLDAVLAELDSAVRTGRGAGLAA